MSAPSERDILNEMGYYNEDTCFCSFRFTPDQMAVVGELCGELSMTSEEVVAAACKAGLEIIKSAKSDADEIVAAHVEALRIHHFPG